MIQDHRPKKARRRKSGRTNRFRPAPPIIAGHKRIYDSARWRRLRRSVIGRDPWCADPEARHARPEPATEVHHLVEARADPARFFQRENLQALCRSCHSRMTARGIKRASE